MMTWDFFFRLLVAGVLGAIIGLDREYRAKEAGFRTHFLVALGSALFMIVSKYGFWDILGDTGIGLDPSRIAAQVVSGIGFLGAGTIIIQKLFVRGLPGYGLLLPLDLQLEPGNIGWESVQCC